MPGINRQGIYLLFSAMAACLWLTETNKHRNKEEFGFNVISEQLTLTAFHCLRESRLFNRVLGSTAFTALVGMKDPLCHSDGGAAHPMLQGN